MGITALYSVFFLLALVRLFGIGRSIQGGWWGDLGWENTYFHE